MANKILFIGVLVIMFYSCNNQTHSQQVKQPKQGGELIEEAYKQGNWDLVISVGDTLIDDNDPHNISIAYAEALATYLFARNNFKTEACEMEKRILKLDPDYKDVKELMHDMGPVNTT